MKDYYQRKQAIFDSEELSLLEMEVEASKLEDEKRVFDLRWSAACAALSVGGFDLTAIVDIEREDIVNNALTLADAMLKAAGVVE